MSKSEGLRAKLAKLMAYEMPPYEMRGTFEGGAKFESERLAPIVERLLDAVDALELVKQRFVWIGVDSLSYPATSAGECARSSVKDIDKVLASLCELTDEVEK